MLETHQTHKIILERQERELEHYQNLLKQQQARQEQRPHVTFRDQVVSSSGSVMGPLVEYKTIPDNSPP